MKERYVKPVVIIETFALTQNIAKNCGSSVMNTTAKHYHGDAYSCAWEVNGVAVFVDSEHNCLETTDPDNAIFLDYCYNNPEPGMHMFGSG